MDIQRCYNCMKEFDSDIDDICPHCGYYQGEQAQDPDLSMALQPGTILDGKYYLGCVLGVGGFAITYVAYNLMNRSKVAIKEYFPTRWAKRDQDAYTVDCGFGENADQFKMGLEQFYKESHQLAKVGSHKGIVNVFDVFTENETAYIVMEFVDGYSMEESLVQEGVMDYTTLVDFLLPICESLDKIHVYEQIIHRDIAPDNILIQPNGRGKLIDFGASTQLMQINQGIILKHGYAPIEQYDVDDYCTAATDVYAMAAVMYHMLTGKRPPESKTRKEELLAYGKDPLIAPLDTGVDIPAGLNDAIMRGLAIEREDRPQSMAAFASMLMPFATVKKTIDFTETVEPRPFPKKLKVALGVGAPLLLAAIVALIVLFLSPSDQQENTLKLSPMPNLIGFDKETAERQVSSWAAQMQRELDNAPEPGKHITVNIVNKKTKTDNKKYKNKVIVASQSPETGYQLDAADITDVFEVTIYYYKYDPMANVLNDTQIEIPDFLGFDIDGAKDLAKKLAETYGLKFDFSKHQYSEHNPPIPKDFVEKQSLKAGIYQYKELKDKTITIVNSDGERPTTTETTTTTTTTTTEPEFIKEFTDVNQYSDQVNSFTAATTSAYHSPTATLPPTTITTPTQSNDYEFTASYDGEYVFD